MFTPLKELCIPVSGFDRWNEDTRWKCKQAFPYELVPYFKMVLVICRKRDSQPLNAALKQSLLFVAFV